MGIGSSRPSTEDRIETKNILNNILDFMIKNADLLDMYSLASPKDCEKYTIFTEKSLKKFFKQMKLYPSRGEEGQFYFQKLDTLAKLPGQYATEQTSNCYELSRFFVRILHIFASISLTIIDIEIPSTDKQLNEMKKNTAQELTTNQMLGVVPFLSGSTSQKGIFGNKQRIVFDPTDENDKENENENEKDAENEDPGPIPRGGIPRGGALPPRESLSREAYASFRYMITDPTYKILNRYLSFSNSDPNYFRFDNGIRVPISNLFTPSTSPTVEPLSISPASITLVYDTTYKATSRKLSFIGQLTITTRGSDDNDFDTTLKIISPKGDELQYFNTTELKAHFKPPAIGVDPRYKNMSLSTYLMSIIDKISGKKSLIPINLTRRKARKFSTLPNNTTSGIPPYYQVKGILTALKNKPTIKAYCVARAIQLMSPDGLNDMKASEARTQICDKSFKLLNKPSSLPSSGSSILTSYGIASLNKLFYDKFIPPRANLNRRFKTDKSGPSISDTVQKEYEIFIKDMRGLYQDIAINNPTSGMNKITNTPNKELCTQSVAFTTTDPDVISGLRTKANKLLSRQNSHLNDAMNILRKLFIINGKQPILLQPAVEQGGMDVVENIAGEARALLLKYYTDCELLYREGIEYVIEKRNVFKTTSGVSLESAAPSARAAPPVRPEPPARAVPSAPPAPPAPPAP